jgi:hypothetical protein
MAAINKKEVLSKDNLKTTFDMIDADGNGSLSV